MSEELRDLPGRELGGLSISEEHRPCPGVHDGVILLENVTPKDDHALSSLGGRLGGLHSESESDCVAKEDRSLVLETLLHQRERGAFEDAECLALTR